ncbi:MAG: hypothetical protein P4L46_22910 [Fimbriimonas sp.]|nr:hypothetical protein [Fimbriimonas sp.]
MLSPQTYRAIISKICFFAILLFAFTVRIAQGQTYTDLFDFNASNGASPTGPAVLDKAGNCYWVIQTGGLNNSGRIIARSSGGSFSVVHDFGGIISSASGKTQPDGALPVGGVTFDSGGNMYGATSSGGAFGGGMVWELTQGGAYYDLHDFGGTVTISQGETGLDGQQPQAGVVLDHSGNLYGTTEFGGPYNLTFSKSLGIVWEITAAGGYLVLHEFGGIVTNANGTSGLDGGNPVSGVTIDGSGNLYGTTYDFGPFAVPGGNVGAGNVWKLSVTGTYLDLHDFGGTVTNTNGLSGPDGSYSIGGVAFDSRGNLFGTAFDGGIYNAGILWEITSAGAYTDVHDFGASSVAYSNGVSQQDGRYPIAGVTFDSVGDMFGTGSQGGPNVGAYGYGVSDLGGALWEIPASGTYQVLHAFGGQVANASGTTGFDGMQPSYVTLDPAGNLYGGTYSGGPNGISSHGYGMLWEIGYTSLSSLTVSPDSVMGGTTTTGSVVLSAPAPSSGSVVSLSSNNSKVTVPSTVTVQPGQTSSTFNVGTVSVSHTTSATLTATLVGTTQTATLTVNPAPTLGLTLNPASIIGGAASTGIITLSAPAGPSGTVVTLSSSESAASPPSTVTVAAGAVSATFSVGSKPVSSNVTATLTAMVGGNSATASLTIEAADLSGLSLNPTSVSGGAQTSAQVSINGAAGPNGVVVQIASSSSAAQVPSSVYVAPGASSVGFLVSTSVVTSSITATIGATQGSLNFTAKLAINPGNLSGILISPSIVVGGQTASGTVTLKSAAPSGGAKVNLSSNNPSATVPATVSIPAGTTSSTFKITTISVTSNVFVSITASQGAVSVSAGLSVMTQPLDSVVVSPASVIGGASATGTIHLKYPALAGGMTVGLSSSSALVKTPSSVTVAAGSSSATFTASTSSVGSATTATITATYGSSTKTATLTVNPPALTGLTVSPSTVVGGSGATGTVSLNSVAPSGGMTVNLYCYDPIVTIPASVIVPAGTSSVHFKVTTVAVAKSTAVTISAVLGGVTMTATLTVSPPVLVSLKLSPATVFGGATSTGMVTLGSAAPQYGLIVNLSSSNANAMVPSYVFVVAGTTTATFTVTAGNVSASTSAIITASTGATSQSADLTINALVVTGLKISPSTVHGGTNATGTIALSGPAGIYGAIVSLASNKSAAAVYPTVYVAAGAKTASFTILTASVSNPTYATIAATMNGSGQYAGLTIKP